MRTSIRVDASAQIGLGHLQRCISLGQALREFDERVLFITRDLGVDVSALLRQNGFEWVTLPAPERPAVAKADDPPHSTWAGVGWELDAAQTAKIVADTQTESLIVDHYAFDSRWHREVRRMAPVRVTAIDDLADRPMDVELLVDHNLSMDHRVKYRGMLNPAAQILGGPRYALLGRAYRAATKYAFKETVRSIGIFMGGTDNGDLSSLALRACRERSGFRGDIEVVTTRSNPHLESLKAVAARWPHTHVSENLPDLAAFFARHDLQIGAGGGATWERCCVGAPSLILVGADNQLAVVPDLLRKGAIASIDCAGPPTEALVAGAVSSLVAAVEDRRGLSECSRRVVDGMGAVRVAARLCRVKMVVRPLSLPDAELTWRWRNDVVTRSSSRDSREISLADHFTWTRAVLSDPHRVLLMGVVGEVKVGVIRFDDIMDGKSEVSLYLDPSMVGLGLGRELLRSGERYLRENAQATHTIVATVLPENAGSRRLFESSGYALLEDRWCKAVDTPLREGK